MESSQIKAALLEELRDEVGVVVWPATNMDIPDDRNSFKVVYLGAEFVGLEPKALHSRLDELHRYRGQTRRQYRNGLVFVVPSAGAKDANKIADYYDRIALPGTGSGFFSETVFRLISIGADQDEPLQDSARALHERAMAALRPNLYHELDSSELKQILGLGSLDCAGIQRNFFPLQQVDRWFFSFPSLPKIQDATVLQQSIAEGLRREKFGLLRTDELLELNRRDTELLKQIDWNSKPFAHEIRFESGFYLADASCRESAS